MFTRRGLLLGLLMPRTLPGGPANRWEKIRYQGGTIDAKVNPFDWNTTVTVLPNEIEMVFAGRKKLKIASGDVLALCYGQKAYRRVADLALMSVIATPTVLFGLLHKSQDHFVSIEFKTESGGRGGVLLTVHKDGYQALLRTLKIVTGKPVENWP